MWLYFATLVLLALACIYDQLVVAGSGDDTNVKMRIIVETLMFSVIVGRSVHAIATRAPCVAAVSMQPRCALLLLLRGAGSDHVLAACSSRGSSCTWSCAI